MCGIFGYIGPQKIANMILAGLKKLEYRGYDSAGLAGLNEGKIIYSKDVGKIDDLEALVSKAQIELFDLGIGHTRWATHGRPTVENAHPHFDTEKSVAVVHNGIIENSRELHKMLANRGVKFVSETDTELIPHLITLHYKGDILEAVRKVVPMLNGAFALAIIHRDFPDRIIAVAHESPLAIGIGSNEAFISSDSHAFTKYTRDVLFLTHGEIAVVQRGHYEVFDLSSGLVEKGLERIEVRPESDEKGEYEHYTLKEIFEQPAVIRNALAGRLNEEFGTVIFDELNFDVKELLSVESIVILGCGTSWHAGFLAKYLIEDLARIPVQIEVSSEYRYKNPIIPARTFVIAISQSGETADTLAATRELQAKGAKVLALVNVHGSTLDRESDASIHLRAGPEIGVCSTKAFSNQYVILFLFTVMLARMRSLEREKGQAFIQAIKQLPSQVQAVLDNAEAIKKIAKKYAHYDHFFFLGRRYMYPTCLEGALKLKEISYINANGYPAGEMKHGPIALINENSPTVACSANKQTLNKFINNLREIKARNGKIIALVEEGAEGISELVDDLIWVPETIDELAAIPTSVAMQLFAYYAAYERGADIDQPRNLAKSVTVE